jgi:hypothetical protein
MRHDFPSGAWAELRPMSALRGTDKRLLDAARFTGYVRDDDGDPDIPATTATIGATGRTELYLGNVRAATAALVITSWSLDIPIPVIDPQAKTVTGGQALDIDLSLDDLNELESILLPYSLALQRQPDPKAPAAATTTSSAGPSPAAENPPTD